ncbi:M48 family metallopeptidase [Geobacter hydrogenophilus]|uniref:Peptidase M48 n=1 Tax=Geobacter hydrogenophilus TaxID=40983 RepID=A0A9W6LBS4_9BACT|nr:M48 family metallopeptidase [Geobacter hydrogenophilus]MBT0893855.1 M48 family metallopeptidase [Geobacter hydrogenophilus]GLI38203.1 peptidase M48 [Geobacter hydrogenophilus]
MTAPGTYYDGRTSARRTVRLTLEGNRLHVAGEGVDFVGEIAGLVVSAPLSTARRSVTFPSGALCEVSDVRFMDELLRRQGKGSAMAAIHRWERSLPLALVALVVTVAVVWGFIAFGIPVLADKVARAVPPATEVSLGKESLAMLDKLVFTPSRLSDVRRRELSTQFSRMTRELPFATGYRLEFRKSDQLGANALALPSGIIVVTDRLVEIAKSDDELIGVLAHEMGHVRHRHALRHVLQNSATGLVVAAITGDITSITSLAATLPTVLIDASYSRSFETEADDAAVAYLKRRGIPLKSYAAMLGRLETEHRKKQGEKGKKEDKSIGDYFSTHPVTEERIRRVLEAGQ